MRNTNRNDTVRRVVPSAIAMGVATALGVAPAPYAQDDEDAMELDRVVVTGTRVTRLDVEGAKPVAVITREDIELSGMQSVSDVLRNTTYNSFGSFRETSGNNFGGQALAGLKGLGEERTLILLNGRRLPRSPVTQNQAIDLNTIPLSAVERVEILTDSASAIYGSDAIGGVINIILRKDYEGFELMGGAARPTQEGADNDYGSFLVGGQTAKGSFLATAEFYNKDIIFSRDRAYSAVNVGDGVPGASGFPNLGTTEGISIAGNSALDLSDFSTRALPGCEDVTYPAGHPNAGQQVYAGVFDYFGTPICGYGYADIAAETTRLKRQSAFLTADYEILPDTVLTYNGVATRTESFGRYAPAVAITEFSLDGSAPNTPPEWQDLGPYWALHRFVGVGPRDDTNTNYLFDHALMLDGHVGADLGWHLTARNTRYDGRELGENYVFRQRAIDLTFAGAYNPFDPFDPINESAYPLIRATLTRDIEHEQIQVSGHVDFDAFELPAGAVGWAFGFDYFDEEFKDIYDASREASDIIGSAGNSASGARVNYAAFAEALLPVADSVEVSVAARWDHYNDSAGEELSPYIAAKWTATDWAAVRVSWGEGFRAPNMLQLYGARAFSAEFGTDTVLCRDQGIPLDQCPDLQFSTFSGGNSQLQPELSDSYNIGAVFAFENFGATVDYWNVMIEDGLDQSTVQSLIDLEFNGQALPPGNSIIRAAPAPGDSVGRIVEINAGWSNLAEIDYKGIDATLDYRLDTNVGDFGFRLVHSHILEANEQTTPSDPKMDVAGTQDSPEFRTNFTVGWSRNDHTVSYVVRHIDSYTNSGGDKIDSFTTHDLMYRYLFQWDGEFTLGLRNLTDEDPPLDPLNDTAQPFNSDLYDMDGRVPYFVYRQRF